MNNIFDPLMFENSLKQINKQNEQALRKIFDSRIKQSFLIDMLHRVENKMGLEMYNYFDMNFSAEKMVTGDTLSVEFDVCRMIVGLHRSDSVFLSDYQRTSLEKEEKYKNELTDRVIEHLRLRFYSADLFRKKQIIKGDEFLFFPVPYKLFVLCVQALNILSEKSNNEPLSWFYSNIFNKSLAALTLIEDNFLDNAYPICRVVVELYFKLLLIEVYPELFDEHNNFVDYDWKKTCCGQKYPEEFEEKYKNRKNQREKSRIDFLHYGWLDELGDYHNVVQKNPYSINGIVTYLEEKNDYEMDFTPLKSLYRMCHSYTHGNVGISKYPLLHYFELSIILGSIVPHVFVMLLAHTKLDRKINDIDVVESINEDFKKLIEQYNMRNTENFESYYSYKK